MKKMLLPSMMCVEDVIDALNWAKSVGGLKGMIARSKASFKVLEDFVAKSDWAEFLAQDASYRSNTSVCLSIKADWFKAKSPEELLARVAAVLRRASAARPRVDALALGDVTVDFVTMTASGDGVSEELTKSESLFLRLLASERGRCFSFDEIFAALRGEGYIGDDNAVRCIAKRLKAKLGRAGELIANSRGIGYKLVK